MKLLFPKYTLPILSFLSIGIGHLYAQTTSVKVSGGNKANNVADSAASFVNKVGSVRDTVPSQPDSTTVPFSLSNPQQYNIQGISVTGSKYLDPSVVASVAGLYKDEKITLPGDGLSQAIRKLWDQKLFSDVAILIDKIDGSNIYLNIKVTERPRLGSFKFTGVGKSAADELKTKTGLVQGSVVTGNTTLSAINKIKKYFSDKGYRDVKVRVTQLMSTTLLNTVNLNFIVSKGEKVRINDVLIVGNDHVSERKLQKQMKGTKEKSRLSLYPLKEINVFNGTVIPPISFKDYVDNAGFLSFSKTRAVLDPYARFTFFTPAKFNEKKYNKDKDKILKYYNSKGYRDAQIARDTQYTAPDGDMNIVLKMDEGERYYFGHFVWKGNTKYPDSILNKILGIRYGDIYDLDKLDDKLGLTPSQQGGDISSLYLDDGYLFFKVTPVESAIRGDTIDFEIRMVEGPQANINKVTIAGNDKTNEHVIRRQLRTIPGDKFSRAAVIRTNRELAQLGFFDPEKIDPHIQPNPDNGTVDIGWNVVEKPSDQLQLSAGWGGYYGLTGTVGLTFNNFSLRNIPNKDAWRPLPSGDGQKLSVQVQSNGKYYSSYNFSFTEPWLGGKKQNPFTIAYYHNKFSNPSYNGFIPIFNDTSYLKTTGVSISYGKQLKWPDDFFSLTYALSYERYQLKSYFNDPIFGPSGLSTGVANNIFVKITLDRNSTDQPIFPRSGSHFFLYGQFTPPYSLFNPGKDYSNLTPEQKFRFIEYQKYRFTGDWYVPLGKPHGTDHKTFVLHASAKLGIIGRYNPAVPLSPFERFELGGDGISNYQYYGKDIISQRGYPVYYTSNPNVNPENANPPATYQGFTIFNKYTLELRYPISTSANSQIWALTFMDAANGYDGLQNYNPFLLRRDVGLGMRFFLPMFGLLGFDYGVGLDRLQKGGGLKNATKFSFMLGYEPD